MLEVHSLVCHRDVSIALVCLKSLLTTSREKVQLLIHDDGSLTDEDQASIQAELPSASVISRNEADCKLAGALEAFPTLKEARSKIPHLFKVVDVPMLCNTESASFVDSDVLFLRAHQRLFRISEMRKVSCRFLFDIRTCHGFRLKDFSPLGPVSAIGRLNSGLFCVKRNVIDFDWVEAVCRRVGLSQMLRHRSWFEQGLWAAIAARVGCEMIDRSQIATAEAMNQIPRDPIALHFVTPVRSLLEHYSTCVQAARSAEEVRSVPASRYTILHAAWNAAVFHVRRLL
jgi:hypothetical protein